MSDYIPTTEAVAFYYVGPDYLNAAQRQAGFERWLASELAAAEKRGAVKVLREAAKALPEPTWVCKSPGCHRADQIALELRAGAIERGIREP